MWAVLTNRPYGIKLEKGGSQAAHVNFTFPKWVHLVCCPLSRGHQTPASTAFPGGITPSDL
jgi:hypothetical protein